MPKSFYVYLWLRQDGSPYYVGKGSGRRAYWKWRKSIRPPRDKSRIVITPMESEAVAFDSEKALIAFFGRKDKGTGILRNMTDGGDGVFGAVFTEEIRQRMSSSHKGKSFSALHRRRIGEPQKGKRIPAEARQKMRAAKLGRKLSEDHRRKLSESLLGNTHTLGHKHSPEARLKISRSLNGNQHTKGHHLSEEHRRKIGMWRPTPEQRQRMSLAQKGRKHSPETRRKMSESQRRRNGCEQQLSFAL